jgi:hypothetical protein
MSELACRICGSIALDLAWDLARSPYGDLFCESKDAALKLPSQGLTLVLCRDCKLLQIAQEVTSEQIYLDYLYQSSVTAGLENYFRRLAKSLVLELGLRFSDLVIDVGSNNGTGLKPYRDAGMRVVGIEPSKVPAETAVAAGIPTINSFLNEASVNQVLAQYGTASLVCAKYLAANVSTPIEFFRNMRQLIGLDGVISVVTGYHPDQFAVNMFDYINHDHLSYFSVNSAIRLAEASGLKLTGAERVEHKGGSIHLIFRPAESVVKPDESIEKLRQREKWLDIDALDPYISLSNRILAIGYQLRDLLLINQQFPLVGIGASISTTHLLHQFELGHTVTRLFDDDVNKVGRFSPGFGIEVSSLDSLIGRDQQFAILLAWQHSAVLVKRMQALDFNGVLAVPLPNPELLHFNSV